MARRSYRRRRNSLVGDTASTMLRISWKRTLLLGITGFIIFSLLVPWFMQSLIASQSQATPNGTFNLTPLLDQLIGRRLHWAERLGEILLWLGILVAGLKLLAGNLENYYHQPGLLGFIARLLARWND
ncbi:hypothetical protein [Aeromonas hydrophila]|uniref:hypothetical protein n=1 Tax=Aeromonas hydrophila TaxID=644 RepID=UPI0032166E32